MENPASFRSIVSFGPFRLNAGERLLEKSGTPVAIGARALDILTLLVDRAGQTVGKRELIGTVWHDVIVDDGSLRFHINALRKALGDGKDGARYLATVPGRGYCFVAPVLRLEGSDRPASRLRPPEPGAMLPARLPRMIGRDAEVEEIAEALLQTRFVTLIGPGGIGKTTIAVSIGHRLAAAFDGAVRFVDLGAIADPGLMPNIVASAVGLVAHTSDLVPSLVSYLQDKRLLLVLDSCEHVVDAAARLTEQIFNNAPEVHILVTSREALRVPGEQVYQLLPLTIPAEADIRAADALTFASVQLFVERVTASGVRWDLTDADASSVVEICRKLDGIPLAIELAAGRVNAYGIDGIAALLGDRFSGVMDGRRTVIARHQTLGATLDWSYDLLSESERTLLRRLSIFVGTFTIEAVRAVTGFGELDDRSAVGGIGNLVSKSLVTVDSSNGQFRYRLLDTTREYARNKLQESHEAREMARRHAAYYLDMLEKDRVNTYQAGPAAPEGQLGNIRAALNWAFGEAGDLQIGIPLCGAATSLLVELSLLAECRSWAERAIAALDDTTRGTRPEIDLHSALAYSLMFTEGNSERVRVSFMRAVGLARDLREQYLELRVLGSLHLFHERIGDYRGAAEFAQRSRVVAAELGDPLAVAAAGSFLGLAQHLAGDHASARLLLENGLTQAAPSREVKRIHFGFDYDNRSRITLARYLWLVGKPDQAVALAEHTIKDAGQLRNPVTLAIALIWGITVLLWVGNAADAKEKISMLAVHAKRHSLNPYHAVALGYRGELSIQAGDADTGVAYLREALGTLHAARYELVTTTLMIALAEGLARSGRALEALATIEEAIGLVLANGDLLYMAEVLRVKGNILCLPEIERIDDAEACFLESAEWAGRQQALSWELRTAMSVLDLRKAQGHAAEAFQALESVYRKFSEGFGSADLKMAKRMIAR